MVYILSLRFGVFSGLSLSLSLPDVQVETCDSTQPAELPR